MKTNVDASSEMAKFTLSDEYAIMVLLVDDQVMVGEAIRRALINEKDIDFHYCADPAEAIAAAQQIQPTVILQDLVMPGADGLLLLRQYRATPSLSDIPVIVLSSKEEPIIKSAAFAAGANDYLVKLPDNIELIARIRHHSKAYLHRLQRDFAFKALRESQAQLVEMNLELQRINNMDGLTGLSNRRYLDEYLEIEWKRAIRAKTEFSVLMVDVDDFKKYNDSYGHLAGDETLKSVARAIRQSLQRPADLAARFGGEEFAVVLPSTTWAGAQHMGELICRNVAALHIPHVGASVNAGVTVSVGGASELPQRESGRTALLEAADVALYQAKRSGKNRAIIHPPAVAAADKEPSTAARR